GRLAYIRGQYRIEGRNRRNECYGLGLGSRGQRKRAARILFWLRRDVQTVGRWRSRGNLGGLRNSCAGNDGANDGTVASTFEFEFSVNVGHTAAHAGQARS